MAEKCVEYMGCKNKKGYGVLNIKKKSCLASRVAYRLYVGKLHPRKFVCHTCDNPACINPKHLYLGNNSTNMLDAVERKRHGMARKTHCKRGHLLSGENLRIRQSRNERVCRECHLLLERNRRGN